MGAASVCLVAPYLAYMRQDTRFNPGEAVTSEYFARLLSGAIDRLITIDPHLHRRNSMQEIYSVPCDVLHAAGVISAWIRENIPQALLIGPDSESEQWVSEVARNAGAPSIVLEKIRHGDRDVEVSVIDVLTLNQDGVLSTGGGSVLRAANRKHLRERGKVIYLKSSPDELFRRLRHDVNRPLLQVADPLTRLRDLYAIRDPLYRETAHYVLETGRPSVATLVNMIVMQLELAGVVPRKEQ